MINIFYKNHLKKSTIMFLPIDFTPPMSKPSIKLLVKILKQKQDWLTKSSTR